MLSTEVSMTKGKYIFIWFFFIGSSYAGKAQNMKDSLYISPDHFILDEMVMSASRWEENLREVPNRISKINSSLIQFQNPQTAADVLGISNNVFIQKSQLGGGSPMIRGFAT